jgi:hypothetical protein
MYYLLAYFVISKSLTRYYIITEILFFILYTGISFVLIPHLAVEGAVIAYLVMNFIALLVHAYFIGVIFFSTESKTRSWLFPEQPVINQLNQTII